MASKSPAPWVEVSCHAHCRCFHVDHADVASRVSRPGPNEPATNPNDLTAIPAGPGTEGHDPTKHKRKQTLLSLLEALAELSKDEELDGTGTSFDKFGTSRHILGFLCVKQAFFSPFRPPCVKQTRVRRHGTIGIRSRLPVILSMRSA